MRKLLLALLFFFLSAMAVLLTGFYMWGSLLSLALLLWIIGIVLSAFACRALLVKGISIAKSTKLAALCAIIMMVLIAFSVGPIMRTGVLLRDQWFLSKLPAFQRTADTIEKTISFDENGYLAERPVPKEAKSPVSRIMSGRDSKGVATIVFVTSSGGFPANHEGYMYRADDTPWKDTDGLSVRRHIAPHWFALYHF